MINGEAIMLTETEVAGSRYPDSMNDVLRDLLERASICSSQLGYENIDHMLSLALEELNEVEDMEGISIFHRYGRNSVADTPYSKIRDLSAVATV